MAADNVCFAPVKESDVSREMTSRYMKDMLEYAETDVVIVGAGPSGLACAFELSKNKNIKVAVIEASVAPGGGGWVGGQLFSPMIVRKPAHEFLIDLGVAFEDMGNYVVVAHAALTTATLIKRCIENGVKLFNATSVEDLIIRNGVVSGVVTNWALVTKAHGTQSCMDPNVMEAKVVVSSCGHDGPFGATGVRRLKELGMIDNVPGMKALDMNASEDAVVRQTREIVPGMIVTGMEVAEVDGTARMGPTFGAMFLSGRKAAHIVASKLEKMSKQ